MGQEIEYKLRAENADTLLRVYASLCSAGTAAAERIIEMHTQYYDTPDRALQKKKWMLRSRQENELQVLTFKTPGKGHCRGEWNLKRNHTSAAPEATELSALVYSGAPAALMSLDSLSVVCEARFTRRCTMLTLADGTEVELAADIGRLCGTAEQVDFYELEIELYGGDQARAAELAVRSGLPEEPRSKAARAMQLR